MTASTALKRLATTTFAAMDDQRLSALGENVEIVYCIDFLGLRPLRDQAHLDWLRSRIGDSRIQCFLRGVKEDDVPPKTWFYRINGKGPCPIPSRQWFLSVCRQYLGIPGVMLEFSTDGAATWSLYDPVM